MMFLGESLVNYGRVVHPKETIAALQSVTADDVQRVANEVFEPARMTLSLVVPTAQPQSEQAWLDTLSALWA